ncbi:hypothetical protein QNO00_02335 [Arthrobacter sp. zg-Y1219]|uniref:hypothetical protein n=1 Tax=Arthrobacter sp. zg-Y1219 TaxID=3049067 RepID=UPI0024C2CEB9|nr:hypothetical protein [Arthrobacter sp. zg-Y1219]MDK1359111.1 hypothetical protein [Arthrobacter sp. zg-Y1219]
MALALVLAGCSSLDQPGVAAGSDSPSPAPGNSAPEAGTNTPASGDPDKAELFRAEDPVSIETYFQTEPQLRPENGSVLLEESATGPSTFELPDMEPGTTFKTFLTCNEAEAYKVQFLDAEGKPVTSTGGDRCNSPNLASYEYPVTAESIPSTVTVNDVNSAEYWLVVYNITEPE